MSGKEIKAAQIALKSIRAALSVSAIKPADRRAAEIYLLVTTMNINQVLTAEVAGCTKQNVSKLLRSVEDRREQPDFDRALSRIETMISGE